jgi:cobalt-precorrin 5A hydrolase
MKIAVITLSLRGHEIAERIRDGFPGTDVYVHDLVDLPAESRPVERFAKVVELTAEIFSHYEGLVYVAPCGVAVRAIAGCLEEKATDPAVVVLDAGARFAVSLLSGHEGGANELAVQIANLMGAEPVISTTTEALKNVIVGVGCRKGTGQARVREAIEASLGEAGVSLDEVRFIATADVKAEEAGLIEAAAGLGIPLRIVASDLIRTYAGAFQASRFVLEKVNLPAVAEPAAMLAGRRTRLLRGQKSYHGVTVALARESFMSSGSAPAAD